MKTNHEELVDKINQIIEKPIQDPKNIKEALTHRSYLNESGNKELKSNERLEFLGDAVIQYWVSQFIFRHGAEKFFLPLSDDFRRSNEFITGIGL